MNIAYYHKNIDHITEGTREYIEERMSTLENVGDVDKVRVEIDQEKNGMFHVAIHVTGGRHVYHASAENADINACAEEVRGELRKQMTHDKKKNRDLIRRGARSLKKRLTINGDARL